MRTEMSQTKRVEPVEKNLEIRLSGSGGQGLILAAGILSSAMIAKGMNVSQSQSYEPTSRGGLSRSDLVISEDKVDYPLVSALDYAVILHQVAVADCDGYLRDSAIVITDSKLVGEPPKGKFKLVELPILETAIKLGNRRVANTIALAALTALGGLCEREVLEEVVADRSPPAFADLNKEALATGWAMSA